MARNSEKAQSMLHRFREQQAIDMGMGQRTKGDRRPRVAATVTSLRECERWRGDILKDVSRKVSKIQDITLTDYEIRDLNDDINSLMREKRHFENQIIALGGANYKRAQTAMTDQDGREVPGTRGYKYFGRARELPGVKELFEKGAQAASEESARNSSFQMFRNHGPEYFGDLDEMDEKLAAEEDAAAREDWETAVAQTSKVLSIPIAEIPYPAASTSTSNLTANPVNGESSSTSSAKRKSHQSPSDDPEATGANGTSVDTEMEEESTKKAKLNGSSDAVAAVSPAPPPPSDPRMAFAASFLGMLDPDSLKQPVMPTPEEMAKVLLEVRKRALREEYGV